VLTDDHNCGGRLEDPYWRYARVSRQGRVGKPCADVNEERGISYLAAFKEKFAASPERANARRKSGRTKRTPNRRTRTKGPPKRQKNFRASAETLAQIKKLATRTRKSETDVIAMAIDALAKQLVKGPR